MDPVTQGVLGASVGQAASRASDLRAAAVLAALSGMAPDLDVLIRSDVDPLLFLEYHRHFTHSLVFIPFGAFCARGVPLVRKWRFTSCRPGCTASRLCDAIARRFTTYGTQLFWPLRTSASRGTRSPWSTPHRARAGPGVVVWWPPRARPDRPRLDGLYMGFGAVQNVRAEGAGPSRGARGHALLDLGQAGFANCCSGRSCTRWTASSTSMHPGRIRRGVYEGVPGGWTWPATAVARPDSQRPGHRAFRWFSNDHLAVLADAPTR